MNGEIQKIKRGKRMRDREKWGIYFNHSHPAPSETHGQFLETDRQKERKKKKERSFQPAYG